MNKQSNTRINNLRLLVLLMLSFTLSANGNVKFNNINKLFGLSMREGVSICKDYNGFIWASHKTGILRLTNDDCRIYHITGEMKDYLTIKLAYSDSILIAYTGNGQIFKYDAVYDKFEQVYNLKSTLNQKFLSLYSLYILDGNLWLATTHGVYKTKGKQIDLIAQFKTIPQRITAFPNKRIVIGGEREVHILNTLNDSIEQQIQISEAEQFKISSMLYLPQNQQLWIGTIANGLFLYSFLRDTCINVDPTVIPKQPILTIETSTDSSIYLGIDGQGIWELNTSDFKIMNMYRENIDDPSSLNGNGVYDIYNDNKRVWVSTFSNGMSYFEKTPPLIEHITHQINNTNSLSNNNVNNIIEDKNGNLWIATNNGICKWNIQSNKWENYYTDDQTKAQVFLALCEDKNGHVWAGTYASGVYVVDENSGKEIRHYSTKEEHSQFNVDFVLDIFEDSNQNIWIGGVHGLITEYVIDKDQFNYYSQSSLNAFEELPDNRILMACVYGLLVIDKEKPKPEIILNGYLVNDVLVNDNFIWACTNGDGIIKFDRSSNKIVKFTIENGMPSNYVNSIIKVGNNLWLGTEHGICKFNLDDENIETFNNIPNLSNLSFNNNASCLLNDGRIACGTNDGLVIFDPDKLTLQSEGKIFIQDITVLGKSIKETPSFKLDKPVNNIKKLNLKFNQNTISFNILPINASFGANFTWKMEGIDEEWQTPSNYRLISYSNLPEKDLQLKIRLLDNTLKNVIDEKKIKLNIAPPFWRTWYFFAIVFIIISSLIYFFLWYYTSQLKQKHNEEKIKFFTNTAHEIRTSLTLIKAPIEELSNDNRISGTSRYYLSIAQEQSNHLLTVVNKLMDFQKVDIGKGQLILRNTDIVQLVKKRINLFSSYAESRSIEVKFESNQKSIKTAVDEQKLEKVIDNLISNAIKYSYPKDVVRVELYANTKEWGMKIIDKGIGISKADQKNLFKAFFRGENAINNKIVGSGLGLLLVKDYIVMHSGEIRYQDNEGGGAVFIITIPIKVIADDSHEVNASVKEKTNNQYKQIAKTEDVEKVPGKKPETKLLIVEDNDELRVFMSRALKKDFIVYEAENGENAWALIKKDNPDLVVSDVMMPNMNGFELCEKIKSNVQTSHIPLLLLSALTGKAEQLNGLGLGADDYLTKPFDLDLLKQKIKSIIKNRKIIRNQLLRFIEENNNAPVLNNPLDEEFVNKMLQIVDKNIDNEAFNKNSFAEAMNVSASLLYKKSKALTGQSPSDFIRVIRLKRAFELIKTKKYSIAEVSELCGFPNANYFSTVFKKHFGKSPTEV